MYEKSSLTGKKILAPEWIINIKDYNTYTYTLFNNTILF